MMPDVTVHLNTDTPTTDFPHYWEKVVGSDRAAITMRQEWQDNLEIVKQAAGFQSVRFHGIWNDEFGLYREKDGVLTLRTLYLDKCFDMLLAKGVKPFVELSFMPEALASSPLTLFWYQARPSAPTHWDAWSTLIKDLATHLINRYGADEVTQWHFEVWNEPDMNSWSLSQEQYFQIYAETATALKTVDQRLKVGGPATSQIRWIAPFLDYCATHHVPIDFFSTHVYPNDPQENLFGKSLNLPLEDVSPRAIHYAKEQIQSSPFPHLPLIISEWSAQNPAVIAHTIKACATACDALCYWTFSSDFEENGPILGFDTEYFGLLDQGHVPRTSFHVFTMLHQLGTQQLETGQDPCLATRDPEGGLKLLAWNLPPNSDVAKKGSPGPDKSFEFIFPAQCNTARVTIIDPATFEVDHLYDSWGRPPSPTRSQYQELRRAGAMPPSQEHPLQDGVLSLQLAANAVAFIEVPASSTHTP